MKAWRCSLPCPFCDAHSVWPSQGHSLSQNWLFRHAWHVCTVVLSSSRLLHPCFLGGTLKQEDDKKNGHYDHHLLLASPSFVATLLSSQTHPVTEILGWHSSGVGQDAGKSLQKAASRPPNSQGTWCSSEDLVLGGLQSVSSSWLLQSHAFAHHGKKLLLSPRVSKKLRK